LKVGVLNALGPDVIAILEKENPAFMCAIVRHGLAASHPIGLAKTVKSDHLGKHLAAVAKATKAGEEPAEPTDIQPWRKDLEILQRTVENNAAATGTCVVAACSTCMGDHPRHKGGKPNCKLSASDGARARGTIREQAKNRWREMDNRAKALSQAQQREYKNRRDQFIDKLAAISDRSVDESDWARPDQAMSNSLQSYISQKPKATGKGTGGGSHGCQAQVASTFLQQPTRCSHLGRSRSWHPRGEKEEEEKGFEGGPMGPWSRRTCCDGSDVGTGSGGMHSHHCPSYACTVPQCKQCAGLRTTLTLSVRVCKL